MALLVAQTRVESGVHSTLEVAYGGVLGALVTLVVFQVLRDDATELYERAVVAAARAYAPYSNFLVGAAVRTRDGRVFDGRQRRERGLPARGLRREGGDRERGRRGLPPGRPRGDRDHRVALRRLPAVAVRVPARPGHLPQPRRRARRATRRPSSCPTRGSSTDGAVDGASPRRKRRRTRHAARDRHVRRMADIVTAEGGGHSSPPWVGVWELEERVRRGRGAAERRQVDARERARGREGCDRLRQAADDAAADHRDRERRRLPARARRPARASSARATRSPSACSAPSTSRSRTSTRCSSSSSARERIGAGDRFIAERVFGLGVPVVIALNKVDRLKPGHIAEQMQNAARLGDFHSLHPVSALTGDGIGELREDLVALLPEGPAYFPTEQRTDLAPELADRRARPREGARAHARGGAARDLGRGRRARATRSSARRSSSRPSRRSRS